MRLVHSLAIQLLVSEANIVYLYKMLYKKTWLSSFSEVVLSCLISFRIAVLDLWEEHLRRGYDTEEGMCETAWKKRLSRFRVMEMQKKPSIF